MAKGFNKLMLGAVLFAATPAAAQEAIPTRLVEGTSTSVEQCSTKEVASQAKVAQFVTCINAAMAQAKKSPEGWQKQLIDELTAQSLIFFPEHTSRFSGCARNAGDCEWVQQFFFEHGYFVNWREAESANRFLPVTEKLTFTENSPHASFFPPEALETARFGSVAEYSDTRFQGMNMGGVGVVFENSLVDDWQRHQSYTKGIPGWEDFTKTELRQAVINHEATHSITENYYGLRDNTSLQEAQIDEFFAYAVDMKNNPSSFPTTLATIMRRLKKQADGKMTATHREAFRSYFVRDDYILQQIREIPGVAEILEDQWRYNQRLPGNGLYPEQLTPEQESELEAKRIVNVRALLRIVNPGTVEVIAQRFEQISKRQLMPYLEQSRQRKIAAASQ